MSESSLSVNLHPLPILNVSDHTNRARLTGGGKVVGALLGSNVNRQVSIANSFEVVLRDGVLDVEFLETRREQCASHVVVAKAVKQVFPTLEVIGWYSSGESPTPEDARIHQKFAEIIDGPIFLLFTSAGGDLPVLIFEAAVDNSKFITLPYGIETGEAERIAVEGVTVGNMGGGDDGDAVIGNLSTHRNAISMLHDRVRVLLEYVNTVSATGGGDSGILQQIAAVSASLPVINDIGFQAEYTKASLTKQSSWQDQGDVDLTKYLALLTKQLSALNDYADKHNVVYPASSEPTQGGRQGGMVGGRRR